MTFFGLPPTTGIKCPMETLTLGIPDDLPGLRYENRACVKQRQADSQLLGEACVLSWSYIPAWCIRTPRGGSPQLFHSMCAPEFFLHQPNKLLT